MKQIFLFSICLHMDDCFSFSFRFIPSPLTSPLLELNLPSIHPTPFFNWLNIYASVRAVEVFTSCYTDHRCHTHAHKNTHTLYHSLFLPSRSFSGVSAVYQSLAGPVPFAVIAATWKLYWLPFSRPGKRKRERKHVIIPSSFSCCTAV